MPFTSFEFAVFFGLTLAFNWRLKSSRVFYQPFLLAANLIFYGLGAPKALPLLITVALANWATARLMHAVRAPRWRKFWLVADVALCLGLLAFFKYFEFFITSLESLGLTSLWPGLFELPEIFYPVGLSFFTFQCLSLAIDHYREPEARPPDLVSAVNFVTFFPTVLSGPIQRAKNFIPQLGRAKYDPESFNLALALILSGLFKKITLSSYLSEEIVRQVFQVPESFSASGALCGIYGYSAQIYLDFSGYSDLALGVALLLGYNVGVNFDAPYLAGNIRDFWRRWHISLSTWLRDYLYIPLGGGRRGNKTVNLLLTQTLGGLWHGAHLRYIIWGLGHGLALAASHFLAGRRQRKEAALAALNLRSWQMPKARFTRLRKFAGVVVTFNFVSLMWILFRAEDSRRAWEVLRAGLDFGAAGQGAPLMAWAIIALTILMQMIGGPVKSAVMRLQGRMSGPVLALWAAFWVVVILKTGPDGVLPFIYFQY